MRPDITIEEAYTNLTPFGSPNPMQRDVWRALVEEKEGGLLLLAPTGSGKTEAVAVPGLALERRLFVILPARSLVDDQIGRFEEMLQKASAFNTKRPYALVVDTGTRSQRWLWGDGKRLSEQPQRRHYYQGDIVVTTLDKFLYRFFGFGQPRKSYVFPLRIHHGLWDPLFCFDEAHTYDTVAWTNFRLLLRALFEKSLDVVAMTATMPQEFADELYFLEERDWVGNPNRRELNEWSERGEPQRELLYVPCPAKEIVERLVEQTRRHHKDSHRAIVAVETVRDAVAVFEALDGRKRDEVFLYHGRLTGERRREVYVELKQREGAGREYLLVTTSAIEVGCDLDAHTLITQICNPENLLQRVGRCNRQGEMTDARVIVVGEQVPGYLTTISEEEMQAAYRATLANLSGHALDSAAVQAHIVKQPNPDDRVEIAFRMLYEYVYDAAVENKPLHDKGLVFTRSWEPSLTLCTGFDDKDRPINSVQVSIERCAAYDEGDLTSGCHLFRRTFSRRDYRAIVEPLRYGGCAYLIDMVAEVPLEWYDEHLGYSELPKLFQRRWQRGYRKQLSRPTETGKSLWLWYLAPREEE